VPRSPTNDSSMTLRVLVVESEAEELLFLRDVLTELDGGREWSHWTHVEASYADSWKEAAAMLATARYDVLVLDLDLTDTHGKETFLRYKSLAPSVPAVLIVQELSGQTLAETLLREGAQDFLIRKQVDCAPLAKAIRSAIDRHRLLAATQAASMVDSLTGLLSRDAFLLLADRDRHLAETLHRRQLLILAEPKQTFAHEDSQARDLGVVDAAEQLRNLAGATDLVARVGLMHLALSVLDSEQESVEEIWARLHGAAAESGISLGVAVFDPERPVELDRLLELAAGDLKPTKTAS
jgi:PleD family two-component response regulator